MSRIRVLHLIEDLGPGGAERLLYLNLSRIDRERFNGTVCCLYARALYWQRPIRELGYPVAFLGMTSLRQAGQGLVRLMRLLNDSPVDLIHTHLYGANLLGRVAGFLKGIPVVSSLHSPDYEPVLLKDNPALTGRKLAVLRWLDSVTCRLAKPTFVAVSHYIKEVAVRDLNLSPDRVKVIYNSVDLGAFQPQAGGQEPLRAGLGLGLDEVIVLCIARFDPLKGVRYLIEAVPVLAHRIPNVTVLIVGDGSTAAREDLKQLAGRLGVASRVRFLGVQQDVRPYLQLCDVFVLPSLAEGLGLALVEAMAMERACVACRVAAIPEVVVDGVSGLLAEPADGPALAGAIARLLEDRDLRQKMGKEGRRIAEQRFSLGRNILDLESTYGAALAHA